MKPRVLIAACLAALALTACQNTPSPTPTPSAIDARAELTAALALSGEETACRVTVTAQDTALVTEFDRTTQVMRSTSTLKETDRTIVSESLQVPGARYFRSYDEGEAKPKWSKTAVSDAPGAYGKTMFTDLLTDDSTVTMESPGRYRVEASAGGKGLLGALGPAEAAARLMITLDAQGRVHVIESLNPQAAVTLTIEYGVTVPAEPPAADEIDTGA